MGNRCHRDSRRRLARPDWRLEDSTACCDVRTAAARRFRAANRHRGRYGDHAVEHDWRAAAGSEQFPHRVPIGSYQYAGERGRGQAERGDDHARNGDDGHDNDYARRSARYIRGKRGLRHVGFVGHDPRVERTRRPRIGRVQRKRAMRRSFLCVSVSLWLVFTAGLPAKAVAQEGTIEQLVATALERSPEIRAARTAMSAAGGQLTQAGLRPNPTFSGSQMLMTGAQHQTLLEVEWPLDLFRREARVGTARHAVE